MHEAPLHHPLWRQAADRDTVESDGPSTGPEAAGQGTQQSRLARAVGAEDGDHLAGVDVEVDPEEDLDGPVPGAQAPHLEEGVLALPDRRAGGHAASSAPR